MKVHITLKSGVTVQADVSRWVTVRSKIVSPGELIGFRWEDSTHGSTELCYVRLEDVSAVVVVREPGEAITPIEVASDAD